MPSSFCGVFGLKADLRPGAAFAGVFSAIMAFARAYRSDRSYRGRRGIAARCHRRPRRARSGRVCRLRGVLLQRSRGGSKGLRVGFSPDLGYAAVMPDVRTAFKQAIDTLANLGADLIAADPGMIPIF